MQVKDAGEFLAYVTQKLQEKIKTLGLSITQGERDIEQMHAYYWENYTEMDQYGYENYDNQQALFRQMSANEDSEKLRRRYLRMADSPFFGRVDFCYEGEEEPEVFYIGIGNFSLEDGQLPLVFDWRAPVSGLFYDFDKGEASYQAPAGLLRGEITSKWQYKIRHGRMVYAFESDVKIDDEVLKAELGEHGDVKLKNIIRTIQREQNAIIRNTTDRILVIQGAAGSGKTSIALHRIAYLLYHDRKNLKSSNVLILSPNGIFADYISQILPELGEENIREMTFDLYAYHQLRDEVLDMEDRCDFLERELAGKAGRKVRESYHYKQSREFANRLEGFILRQEDELMRFVPVTMHGFTMTEDQILDLFYDKFAQIPLLARMEAVQERFEDEIQTLRQKDLSQEDHDALTQAFASMYEQTDIYLLYDRFLREEGMQGLSHVPPQERYLSYEDVYPLLYLKYRLRVSRPDSSIRHLVVDEMQDYSWLQYVILQKMFSCRMTILGDRAQTMDEKQSDALHFLPGIFGKDIRCITIDKCYRNTVEIASWANALAGLTGLDLVERHGKPVAEEAFGSEEAALAELAARLNREGSTPSFETAAVITLTEDAAQTAARFLRQNLTGEAWKEKGRISHLHRNSTSFRRGLTVTTFYLAKGLEFDRVYMLFPRNRKDPLATQARYIAATRALHELSVLGYGEL